jgi:glyoxylase I family protein
LIHQKLAVVATVYDRREILPLFLPAVIDRRYNRVATIELFMPTGDIHHIRLAVKNLSESTDFYTNLLGALGYTMVHQTVDKVSFHHLDRPLAVILSQAQTRLIRRSSRGAPGLHHLAFHAESKGEVDRIYLNVLLRFEQIRILDPPCECPEYSPGYYAVFFEDPNGIKLEIAFTPAHFHQSA